ncbi:hypothetical protein [Nocardioides sp.]|uniref:hypothetical protein n=1 Tax=Nocardioides sp. TaxID=35761 RepID=UPI003561E439
MARVLLKLGNIAGPVNASGDVAVAGGQPQGFSLDGVFNVDYGLMNVASSVSDAFKAGGAREVGAPQSDLVQVSMQGTVKDPDIFKATVARTLMTRACLITVANATGGVATEWVRAYQLFKNVTLASYRTVTEGGNIYHDLSFVFDAEFHAFFATPSGGNLGQRTSAGWDYVQAKEWNGSV